MTPVVAAVVAKLEAQLEDIERRATTTAEDAVHDEARPEDPKDTRGLETSYLAHGLAQRAGALENDVRTLRFMPSPSQGEDPPIVAGAQFTLEDEDGDEHRYILLPCAGGIEVMVDGVSVRVVTPTSPLGRGVLEKRAGDDTTIRVAGKLREYVVVSVG